MDAVDESSARLLRIEQVAERLSVSRSMAWKIINDGQLRSLRIGRVVRVRPEDLDGYLGLVPNHVVDGLRARIFRLLVWKPQSKEGPSCPMLTPA